MGSYEFLAGSYDALTLDVDYPRWADYVEGHFRRLKRPVETVCIAWLCAVSDTGGTFVDFVLRGVVKE